jgi:hypothetical protein
MLVVLSTTKQTVNDLVQRDEDFHRPGATGFAGVSVTITNTGQQAGAETVELYATPSSLCPSPSSEPKQKLVGFQRCWSQRGEVQGVTIPLNLQNLRRWDDPTHQYKIDPGTYLIYARSSSDTPDAESASCRLTLAGE